MRARLLGILGLGTAIAAGCGDGTALQQETRALAVDPAASGIEHVVVVMMENRSFDHLLGWLDGADGRQAGLQYPARNGRPPKTHALAPGGLEPLTVRDQTANNLADALDFTTTRTHVPLFGVPPGPFGRPCPPSTRPPPEAADLDGLAALATSFGWPIGNASLASITTLLRQAGSAP